MKTELVGFVKEMRQQMVKDGKCFAICEVFGRHSGVSVAIPIGEEIFNLKPSPTQLKITIEAIQ
ncbi:MAG: hypothetical protein KGL39_53415 [Patescibacteria group bacterium]|nr:hypothetical protein [Patescibacteria group bacterium]